MRTLLGLAAACVVGGCSTVSFAPPEVTVAFDSTKTTAAAISTVDSYVKAYRKSLLRTADGRQWFEVPAALGTLGATTAAAFGAGHDVAIGSGAAAALLGAGRSYYSPAQKRGMYNSALDAMLCIQGRAVGLAPYEANALVSTPSEEQRYYLIRNAAFAVERILADRLSSAGSFPGFGAIAEEYKSLIEAKEQTEDKVEAAVAQDNNLKAKMKSVVAEATLQEELQLCVLRAKT